MNGPTAIPRQHFPTYEIGDDLYVVDPGREKLFRFDGQTRNPRVVALADAAVVNGELDTVHTDGKTVLLQHHMAGIERRYYAADLLDDPIPVFSEAKAMYAGDVVESVRGGASD